MTSRMAVNYPDRFRAFAIVGGSYYYCSGGCNDGVADQLPTSVWNRHGPTLFLHGANDGTVPAATSELYHQRLTQAGVRTRRQVQSGLGHAWVRESATEITNVSNWRPCSYSL